VLTTYGRRRMLAADINELARIEARDWERRNQALRASGVPLASLTTYANQKVQNALWQAAALGGPATWYVGLLVVPNPAGIWTASTAYSAGAYVIPTTFGSISGQQGKIFKCTTAGTSAATQPTWPTGEGATVVDNTITWTEVSLLFQAGTFTGAESTGTGYARQAVTANSTNFAGATSAEPCVTQNATAISGWAPTADWGYAVGVILADASTAGNIWDWGAMTSALDCPNGSSPSIGVNALSLSISALLTA
jgi:hypothetical protein